MGPTGALLESLTNLICPSLRVRGCGSFFIMQCAQMYHIRIFSLNFYFVNTLIMRKRMLNPLFIVWSILKWSQLLLEENLKASNYTIRAFILNHSDLSIGCTVGFHSLTSRILLGHFYVARTWKIGSSDFFLSRWIFFPLTLIGNAFSQNHRKFSSLKQRLH